VETREANVHFVMTVLAVPATSIPITRAMLPLLMDMLAYVFESNVFLVVVVAVVVIGVGVVVR
jgi:hypothetical protein